MDNPAVPPLLYHYTDIHGFKGIVDSQELWATHIQYLNDAREYHHAAGLAAGILLERAEQSVDPRERALLTRLGTGLSARRGMANVCVASFSAVDDSLSQWRGYCPNGAGYSLGFVPQDLGREAARQGFFLARCLYDEESQREAILQVLEKVQHSVHWTEALKQDSPATHNRVNFAWLSTFTPLAPTIKHRAFQDEQEWRLISAPIPFEDRRWRVRPGRSMLIPYLPITLAPPGGYLPIRDLVVGPTPHMELALMAAGVLLEPKLEPIPLQVPMPRQPAQIRNSVVPYRNW